MTISSNDDDIMCTHCNSYRTKRINNREMICQDCQHILPHIMKLSCVNCAGGGGATSKAVPKARGGGRILTNEEMAIERAKNNHSISRSHRLGPKGNNQ